MPRVFVGIGSNTDRETNIRSGIHRLRERFGELQLSPVYESKAVGFEGDNFYNLVTGFATSLAPDKLVACLHGIEDACHRDRSQTRFSSRTLDLDLLLYADRISNARNLRLPRREITEYAFVLRPLADIAGDLCHPVSGSRFADLWAASAADLQPCWRVAFDPGAEH